MPKQPKDYPTEPSRPKRSFFQRNPTLKKPFYGACILAGIAVLVGLFGPDRVWGLVEQAAAAAGFELAPPSKE
jgi:hypothetical protein